MKTNLFLFICIVIVSVSIAWWLFFFLIVASVFVFKKIYPGLFAGFVLDVIYFSHTFPKLLIAAFFTAILFLLVKNKLRYNA